MKAFIGPVLVGLLASAAMGAVSVQVYRADEITPLEWADPNVPDVYEDIMVGTRLTLFLVSDAPASTWSGGLQISLDDWTRGTLSGKGYDPNARSYDDSVLPAAGLDTYIRLVHDGNDTDPHFSLAVDDALVGEWFVLDYNAQALGTCGVGVYSVEDSDELPPDHEIWPGYDPPAAQAVWVQGLLLNHVPSRDYDGDSIVNFVDFALWAERWQETLAADPNAVLVGDLDANGRLDVSDLASFCEFWLERTDVPEALVDPNSLNNAL